MTTRAVVLRRVDYRDSDRIVTLFTESLGKVGAIARAARSSQKRFAGGLESLCVVEVTLEAGRGDLAILREAHPVLPCLTLLGSLERIEAGGTGLELVRGSLADRHPEPELFEHVVRFLLDLDAGVGVATRLLRFQLDVLDALGLSPELEQCAVCGKPVPDARVALFRAAAGGVVCRACGGGSVRLSAATRTALLAHRRGDDSGADPWPSDQQAEARALVTSLCDQHGLRPGKR